MNIKPTYYFKAGIISAVYWLLNTTCPAATAPEQNLDRTFQVAPGGKLVIQADRGAIRVDTDATDSVHVRVLREAKEATNKQKSTGLFCGFRACCGLLVRRSRFWRWP